MNSASDMRIPVLFGAVHTAEAVAWLVEEGAAIPASGYILRFKLPAQKFGHIIGCNCCTSRGPAAEALTRMFRARATGAAPFFKTVQVNASPAGEAAVREAISDDVSTAARYVLRS